MKKAIFTGKLIHPLAAGERGSLLLIGFMALLLLSLIGLAATTSTNTETRIANNHKTAVQALYAAEAGIQHARAVLKGRVLNDPRKVSDVFNDIFGGPDGDPIAQADNGKLEALQNVSLGNGHYSVTIMDGWDYINGSPGDGDADGQVWQDSNNRVFIKSTGVVGKAQRVILVELEIISTPLSVDGAVGIYTTSPIVEVGGTAEISGHNHDTPADFDCSGAACTGALHRIDGEPAGIHAASALDFRPDGHAYSVVGSNCQNPYCPDSIVVGGGAYDNTYWAALTNSLKPLAHVTLDGATAAGIRNFGTRADPQIVHITSEVTFSAAIDGAGILIVEDGIHFTEDSHYEGLVLVVSNDSDADCEVTWGTETPSLLGAFVITGPAPAKADLQASPSITYSRQALENVKNKFYRENVLWWKDMAFN